MLAQPLNSSEVLFSEFPAAVLGEPGDEVPHSRVQGHHPHLVWCLGPQVALQVALTEVGSHSFERYAQVVLVMAQCEFGVAVGVGYWFPPFQFPQDGVVDAFLAEGRCVDENGLAGVLPGAEMCPCVVSLLSESLGLVGRQLPVELLGGADCQACVPYGVALHLIGGWLGPVGQSGEDILLDCQPGGVGGAVGAQEFDGPVVGEPAGVEPEFKLGPLVPVWVDSDLPGFSSGTFGVRWLWQRRQ